MAASEAKRTALARTQRGARYGAGTLVSRAGPNGDTWIAKWRDGGRQVQRGLGFVHSKKHPEGARPKREPSHRGSTSGRSMAGFAVSLPKINPRPAAPSGESVAL